MDMDPQADNPAGNQMSNTIIITKFKVNYNFNYYGWHKNLKYFILISVRIIFEF